MKKKQYRIITALGSATMIGGVTIAAVAQACGSGGSGGGDVPIGPVDPAIKESITAIFTGLDGFQVGSRNFSEQENVIVSGILNSVNSIGIGVINPSNLSNTTFNEYVDQSTIRFDFVNDTPVITGSGENMYSVEIPTLTVEVESLSPQSETNITYQGLTTEVTGSSVIVSFNFAEENISNFALSDGELSRVAPDIMLDSSQIETLFTGITSRLLTGNFTNFDFATLVSDDTVSVENLSLYSFINYISYTAGLSTAFVTGHITEALEINATSNDGEVSLTITSNQNVFQAIQFQGAWSINPVVRTVEDLVFLSPTELGNPINVEIYGTQENPILLFNPGANSDYGVAQLESLGNLFVRSTPASVWASIDAYQSFLSVVNSSFGNGVVLDTLTQTSQLNFESIMPSGNTYTAIISNITGTTAAPDSRGLIANQMTVIGTIDPMTQRMTVMSVSGLSFS